MLEKPPGANIDETRLILAAAEAAGVTVAVGVQRRFTVVVQEAMRLVGERGTPTVVSGTFNKMLLGGTGNDAAGAYGAPKNDTSRLSPLTEDRRVPSVTTTLWNDGIHIVDTVRYMAGGESLTPMQLTSSVRRFEPPPLCPPLLQLARGQRGCEVDEPEADEGRGAVPACALVVLLHLVVLAQPLRRPVRVALARAQVEHSGARALRARALPLRDSPHARPPGTGAARADDIMIIMSGAPRVKKPAAQDWCRRWENLESVTVNRNLDPAHLGVGSGMV